MSICNVNPRVKRSLNHFIFKTLPKNSKLQGPQVSSNQTMIECLITSIVSMFNIFDIQVHAKSSVCFITNWCPANSSDFLWEYHSIASVSEAHLSVCSNASSSLMQTPPRDHTQFPSLLHPASSTVFLDYCHSLESPMPLLLGCSLLTFPYALKTW